MEDVIIIGGGPAGASLGSFLSKAGNLATACRFRKLTEIYESKKGLD